MTKLELQKLKAELLSVQAAKANLEVRIEERLEEIAKLKEHIAVSLAKEHELTEKIKG